MKNVSINKGRLLKTFLDLVQVSSPSFQEEKIGRVLAAMLTERGCKVTKQRYDRSFNLIAYKKGNTGKVPPILLSGHMDTIEPTEGIKFTVRTDRVSSIGNTVLGADDKSALAQILEALSVLQENDISHGDVEIFFSSAEEKGLHGAKNLDFGKVRSRYGLVLDSGGSVGKLVIAAPTHLTYEMQITGKAAHAGIEPEKGISAIRLAAEIISSIPNGRISAETTTNVGMISGGTATNVVPEKVLIKGELRSHDDKILKEVKTIIFDTARRIVKSNKARIRISEIEEYKSFRISGDDRFLQFTGEAVKACGMKPVHVITGGGSDANILNQQGIKTINVSTGMQNVHSNREFILLKDLYRGSLLVLTAITRFVKFQE